MYHLRKYLSSLSRPVSLCEVSQSASRLLGSVAHTRSICYFDNIQAVCEPNSVFAEPQIASPP